MTNEEASIIIGNIPIPLVILGTNDKCYSLTEYQQAKAMAIKALEQSTQEVLEELRQEIWDITSTHLDSQEYALIRKSDVMDIINKHLQEVIE